MWRCQKCGREFQNENQQHYCGESPKTVEAYIAEHPLSIQIYLNQVRKTLLDALPSAQECISWRMPTYWDKHNIFHFAAFKNHIGIYPGSEAIEHFSNRLVDYKTSKGAIQLPYNKPLPLDLIAEIAKWCHLTGNHH